MSYVCTGFSFAIIALRRFFWEVVLKKYTPRGSAFGILVWFFLFWAKLVLANF